MDRNRLAHKHGNAINPVLATTGYNFRLILKWIRILYAFICRLFKQTQGPLFAHLA